MRLVVLLVTWRLRGTKVLSLYHSSSIKLPSNPFHLLAFEVNRSSSLCHHEWKRNDKEERRYLMHLTYTNPFHLLAFEVNRSSSLCHHEWKRNDKEERRYLMHLTYTSSFSHYMDLIQLWTIYNMGGMTYFIYKMYKIISWMGESN